MLSPYDSTRVLAYVHSTWNSPYASKPLRECITAPHEGKRSRFALFLRAHVLCGVFCAKDVFSGLLRYVPAAVQRILRQSFLFNSLDEKDLNTVILAMQEKKIEASTCLIREGDDGECLYIVQSGELNCSKLIDGEERVVKVVGPGDAFGELALLYNAPRAATVTSVSACDLWELGRDTFNAIVKDAATKRRSMYDSFLKSVHILDGMDAYERGKVADALRTEMFTDGAYIVRQGELGDVFYIVEEGSAVATKSFGPGQPPIEVKKYQAGDYFGELALINEEPRAANVIAHGICKVACLERKSFKRLMGSVQDLLSKKASEYKRESD
ncbi:cyclic nucleotide-binding domain-containing protein [Toxoplasma gondii GT1]|uniref:Cyclic nucleotide-binding domain-containing protein n=2 Tax=Toxoplasma gondii TaxID=5811 RepID=S7UTQ9_TOXGG|nr:cyclic nucleotide-binding domain-containing protein [Toxoplasma gondii GT1]KAF4639305.1 cyclic nucleotide-binding domain-containing protein [Toxoplasma gondii]